jgi:hypothetical protein
MITAHIDIGQVVISGLLVSVTIIGWFIKRELSSFCGRLNKHDDILISLTGNVQRLTGLYDALRRNIQ